ncbi:MAG TPA: hypothetical protein PLX89_14735 [Verrucomicrobiota bacterium]|nr:hypothetical protein [Verrucomicrobiota bacterium]
MAHSGRFDQGRNLADTILRDPNDFPFPEEYVSKRHVTRVSGVPDVSAPPGCLLEFCHRKFPTPHPTQRLLPDLTFGYHGIAVEQMVLCPTDTLGQSHDTPWAIGIWADNQFAELFTFEGCYLTVPMGLQFRPGQRLLLSSTLRLSQPFAQVFQIAPDQFGPVLEDRGQGLVNLRMTFGEPGAEIIGDPLDFEVTTGTIPNLVPEPP